MINKIEFMKRDMRRTAIVCRNNKCDSVRSSADRKLFNNFFDQFCVSTKVSVAGYWAKGSEVNVEPILLRLNQGLCNCLLPSIININSSLEFREWKPGDYLTSTKFGFLEPTRDKTVRTPEIILVPLLAFDKRGRRLGYGGGYYDRTLMILRSLDGSDDLTAIGVCYADQEVEVVPTDENDQLLDWIVTEQGVHSFSSKKLKWKREPV